MSFKPVESGYSLERIGCTSMISTAPAPAAAADFRSRPKAGPHHAFQTLLPTGTSAFVSVGR